MAQKENKLPSVVSFSRLTLLFTDHISPGLLLYCEQSRPLVILLLFGRGDFCSQIQRLLEEVHQHLLGQQGRQDLSVTDRPLVLRRWTPDVARLRGARPCCPILAGDL